MKILLDTHLLLWAAGQPDRLSLEARKFIDNPANELLFSAASLWEVVIKRGLGRDDFKVDTRVLRPGIARQRIQRIADGRDHVGAIDTLPAIHKDPFDRVLIAQATIEGITLPTTDSLVAKYPGPIRTV